MAWFLECKSSLLWNSNFKLHMHVDSGHRQEPIDFQRRHFQNGRLVAILDFLVSRLLILVWPWISTPNLSGTILMYMCRGLLIFSNVNFKMAARWPYWIFFVSGLWVGAYWFSETSLSKWPPGGHIGYFGFQTLTLVWLWISTPNFSGTILMYMGKSLLIFSDLIF